MLLGEAPGNNEESLELPFVGESGRWLDSALKRFGANRDQFLVTNALLCRPKNKLKEKEWAQAIECCRPHLEEEFRQFKSRGIIALGGRAMQAINGYIGVHSWVGQKFETQYGPMVTTYHPVAVMRKASLKSAALNFLRRGLLAIDGKFEHAPWRELLSEGTDAQYMEVLQRLLADKEPIGVDVETGGTDPYEAPLLCVGLANRHRGVSISWPMSDYTQALVQKCLSTLPLIFHNGQHDILTLRNNGLVCVNYYADTMFNAAVYNGQAPKDLGFVAACVTDLEKWKSLFKRKGGFAHSTLADLKGYNAQDSQGTAYTEIQQRAKVCNHHNGAQLAADMLALGKVMMEARHRGLLIDRAVLQGHTVKQTKVLDENRVKFAGLVSQIPGKYTLGKSAQTKCLKDLFFNHYALKPLKYSEETGEPCLNAFTLEQYKACDNAEAREVAGVVLNYRKAGKLISTYLEGLPISPDGRVHSSFRVDGTVTGRQSSSDPNVQNWPKFMRDMVVPTPGNVFVAADLKAAEQYAMALLSGAQNLLTWLRAGEDPHQKNAEILGVARNVAKTPGYAVAYGAGEETVWAQLKSKGVNVPLKFVRELFVKYFEVHPEIKTYQARLIRDARENKYVEEVLSGRREFFYDGEVEPTQVVNYPIQGFVATLINRATLKVAEQLDWKTQFLVVQVHDELMLEVPEKDALWAAKLLVNCMEQEVTVNGESITIPADAKIGYDWFNLKEVKV